MLPFDRERERKVSGRVAKTISIVVIMLMIISSITIIMTGTVKAGSTLEVGPAQAYTTISAAMAAANDGDTILVHTGVYDEAVVVNKKVSIIGVPSEVGAKLVKKSGSNVFTVTVPWVNITGLTIEDGIAGIAITETGDNSRIVGCNVTKNQRGVSAIGSAINLVKVSIIDNTITNNSETGVYAYQTNGLRVGGNEITDNGASSNMDMRDMGGVWFDNCLLGRIENNTVANNSKTGIYIMSCINGMRIENNTVSGNGLEGVLLQNTQPVSMRDNDMLGNMYDLSVEIKYDHSIAESNLVSGKKVYYYVGMDNLTVPKDAGYVGVYHCRNVVIKDLNISKVGQGVLVAESDGVVVDHLSIRDCLVGIDVIGSNNNTVKWSNISHCYNYGISIIQPDIGNYGGNSIENSTVSGSFSPGNFGNNIFIAYSKHDRIADCNISQSTGAAVFVSQSDGCEIMRNTVTGSQGGAAISFDASKDGSVRNNSVKNNYGGIQVLSGSNGTTIKGNQVIDNDLVAGPGEGIAVRSSGTSAVLNNLVTGNKLGIVIESSIDCDVENNTVSGHVDGAGVGIKSSSLAKLMNNRILDNKIGIEVGGSPNLDIVLADNVVQDCAQNGVSIIGTVSKALVQGNRVSGIGTGFYCIYLGPTASQNLIYDNSFTGKDNAYDGGSKNRWNVTLTSGTNVVGGDLIGGNYYSNNTASDANLDGICDSNYTVGPGVYDDHPLFMVDQPSSPRNLTVVPGDVEVKLAWETPESDGGWPLTGYNIYRGTLQTSPELYISLGLVLQYTDTNVTNGIVYHYQVAAKNSEKVGVMSNMMVAIPVDKKAPKVVSTYPYGEVAPVTQNVTIEFDENMKDAIASIDGKNMTVTIVGKEVRCAIPFDIELDTTYMVMVNGSDLAGNHMDEPYFFNFTTTDKVKVTGRVIDSDGKPVGGAYVTIGIISAISDPEGNFTMYVPPGTYPITIEADGLDPYIDNITISASGGDLDPIQIEGSQDKEDDTNWLVLIGGIAGLVAGIVLLVLVFRMMKKSKKEEGRPPVQ